MRTLLIVLLITAGCAGPDRAYLEADRATYEAIAPEYLAYVDADPALDAAQQERRHRTVESWMIRIEAAEGGR